MSSHNVKQSGSIRNQNHSDTTKKKEIKPPAEGPKSVFDRLPSPVFRGFSQDPVLSDESDVAPHVAHGAPVCSTDGIIGDAMARGPPELNVADKKRVEAKGKGEAALEQETDFEMVDKNDDDEDVVVVEEDDIEATENEEDDYVVV